MSDSPIENILSRATHDVRKLLEEAFEAGRALEREAMKRQLLAVLTPGDAEGVPAVSAQGEIAQRGSLADEHIAIFADARASPGTVKPVVERLIENANNGISTSEIIEKTGFKENSVRGTLSALKAEGFAERNRELWFLSQRKGSLTGASEPF